MILFLLDASFNEQGFMQQYRQQVLKKKKEDYKPSLGLHLKWKGEEGF